ncbi:MAG: pitrilysin family protein [candidate division WOR-3 bacterium]
MLKRDLKGLRKVNLNNSIDCIIVPYKEKVASLVVVYNVGSANEERGKAGVAHLLEHLMFNGTKNFQPFSAYIDSFGGYDNAFTDKDITVYYEVIPADKLYETMVLEADRVENLSFNGFETEREVILNEYYMSEDEDDETLWTETFAHLMPENPYSHPVIGWESDLKSLKLEDVKGFYERFYSLDNLFVVVVSPFDYSEVINLLENTFGRVEKRGEKAKFVETQFPPYKVYNEILLKKHNYPNRFAVSWRLQKEDIKTNLAFNIFTRILDLDRTSPIWTLVERGSLDEFSARLYEYRIANVLSVIGECPPEESPPLDEIIKLVENFEPDGRVFNRVKKMIISEIVQSFDEAENIGINTALNYALFGITEDMEGLIELVESINLEDMLEIPKLLQNSPKVSVRYR